MSLQAHPQPPLIDVLDQGVLTLTLNRPDKLNALDQGMIDALHAALDYYAKVEDVRAVILTGSGGRSFAAGADIAQLRDRTAIDAFRGVNATLFDKVANFRVPTIAAIVGFALGGGCELAIACDLRVSGHSGRFGQPETGLGILAAAGATWRLPALIGLGRARELLFTGRIVDAEEALQMGLVNAVVPDEEVADSALHMAQMIARNDPLATRLTKQALAAAQGDVAQARRFADTAQALLFDSPEKFARMDAFLARKHKR